MSPSTRPGQHEPDVWLVRHGETEWAALGRHTSRTDVPLTDAGRAQALALAGRLAGQPFGLILSSPLGRALETARLAGFGERVMIDDDLREWDYGRYEGLTSDEIRRTDPGWTIWRRGAPGGETGAEVAARVDRAIARCRSVEGPVLVFAHAHLLRAFAARWLGLTVSGGRHFALGVATISVLGWERGTPVVERWNEPGPTDA